MSPPDPARQEALRQMGRGETSAVPRAHRETYQDPPEGEDLKMSSGSLAVGSSTGSRLAKS